MLTILFLMAAGSMWVIYPRLAQQVERLQAQALLLENAPSSQAVLISDVAWIGSRPGMMMTDARTPGLDTFTSWAGPQPARAAAFAGGRDGGAGERLVVVQASPTIYGEARPPELHLTIFVYRPGGWLSRPELLSQTATVLPLPVEPAAGWALRIFSGRAVPVDPASFQIPVEVGYEGQDAETSLTLQGTLQRNDRVRFSFPPPATEKSSKLTGDDPLAQPSAGGAP